MRWAFLPASGPAAASSRIRVYSFLRVARRIGVHAKLGYHEGAEALFVQKRVDDHRLQAVSRALGDGCTVVFDVDDLGPALGAWTSPELFTRMLGLADIVTVATPEQADLLARQHGFHGAIVYPNVVDYHPGAPSTPDRSIPSTAGEKLRVLWFGNAGNFHMFEKLIPALERVPDLQIGVCTDQGACATIARRYPSIVVEPWALTGFVDHLRTFHLCCLTHDGDDFDRAKSDHKMITAIVHGVPALVSRTPRYDATARTIGFPWTAFDDPGDLVVALERLRPQPARSSYLEKAQKVVWELHSPFRGVLRLTEIVRGSRPRHQVLRDGSRARGPERSQDPQRQVVTMLADLVKIGQLHAGPDPGIQLEFLVLEGPWAGRSIDQFLPARISPRMREREFLTAILGSRIRRSAKLSVEDAQRYHYHLVMEIADGTNSPRLLDILRDPEAKDGSSST